jgi:hypothetical protein
MNAGKFFKLKDSYGLVVDRIASKDGKNYIVLGKDQGGDVTIRITGNTDSVEGAVVIDPDEIRDQEILGTALKLWHIVADSALKSEINKGPVRKISIV